MYRIRDVLTMRLCQSSLAGVQLQEPTKCPEIDVKLNLKKTMSAQSFLSRLPPSTMSVLKRCLMTCLLIGGFLLMLYGGPPFLVILILAAQVQSWREVTVIALKQQAFTGRHNMHYFFLCALVYFWCDNLLIYYHQYTSTSTIMQFVENYYKFICFCFYILGVIWFVINMKRRFYRRQFGLLAWTHILTLVIIAPSCLITKPIYQGIIWFVICVTTITSNDIMAYICGKLFGKTPLIAVSPKKTWEGFIGAGIFTIAISCFVSYWLLDKQHLICPVEYKIINGEVTQVNQCIPDVIFQLSNYNLFGYKVQLYPIIVHTFWLAIFGSVVAPFGGFFASGFKRACNIKDFGASIPGHGGVLDRFDCQLVMIVFIHVYISTFVERNSITRLYQRITNMSTAQQMEMYHLLENSLL